MGTILTLSFTRVAFLGVSSFSAKINYTYSMKLILKIMLACNFMSIIKCNTDLFSR